jgi:hypothetical protein
MYGEGEGRALPRAVLEGSQLCDACEWIACVGIDSESGAVGSNACEFGGH